MWYTSVFLLLLMTLVRNVCEREFLFQLGEFSRKAGMKFQKSLPAQFWLWLDQDQVELAFIIIMPKMEITEGTNLSTQVSTSVSRAQCSVTQLLPQGSALKCNSVKYISLDMCGCTYPCMTCVFILFFYILVNFTCSFF